MAQFRYLSSVSITVTRLRAVNGDIMGGTYGNMKRELPKSSSEKPSSRATLHNRRHQNKLQMYHTQNPSSQKRNSPPLLPLLLCPPTGKTSFANLSPCRLSPLSTHQILTSTPSPQATQEFGEYEVEGDGGGAEVGGWGLIGVGSVVDAVYARTYVEGLKGVWGSLKRILECGKLLENTVLHLLISI